MQSLLFQNLYPRLGHFQIQIHSTGNSLSRNCMSGGIKHYRNCPRELHDRVASVHVKLCGLSHQYCQHCCSTSLLTKKVIVRCFRSTSSVLSRFSMEGSPFVLGFYILTFLHPQGWIQDSSAHMHRFPPIYEQPMKCGSPQNGRGHLYPASYAMSNMCP